MSAAHTAGPWLCSPSFRTGGSSPGIDVGADNGTNVAIVHYDLRDTDAAEVRANARLIAAAPRMLAELRKCAQRIRLRIDATGDFSDASLAESVENLIETIETGC